MKTLKELRLEKGLSRTRVSMGVPISYSYLARIEDGIDVPALKTAKKLAAYFSVPLEDIHELANVSLVDPRLGKPRNWHTHEPETLICPQCGGHKNYDSLLCWSCHIRKRQSTARYPAQYCDVCNAKLKPTNATGLCYKCYHLARRHTPIERRERLKLLNRQKVLERRKVVFAHYGNVCSCCGESHIEFLTIDHINGDGKEHRKQVGQSGVYKWLIRNNFPSGYRLLCMNCNWVRGVHGYCPHERERSLQLTG